jgi:MtN3 and saliva related transmembrane protein
MNVYGILGYLAAVLTTVSFVPQAYKTIKTKDTRGISLIMYLVFSTGVLCWFIYGIATHNTPVTLANGVTLIFAIIILFYKMKYK